MKAIQYERFGGPDVLEYLDLPNPPPGSGQLLIETAAIGVNFPDIRERLGVYNKAETRVGGVQLPQVGGLAVAGTVVAAGPQTSVEAGRKVVALMKKGAYAQLAVAEEPLCAVIDDDADQVTLAGFAAQAACAHLLLQASTTLRAGESLLVHGAAGGVGSLAVQIAKALGAKPVIGTASTAERREFVKSLGADAAISYEEPGWTEQVRELTAGRGVDVLIESNRWGRVRAELRRPRHLRPVSVAGFHPRPRRAVRPTSVDDEIASPDWLLPSGVLRPARVDRERAALPRGRPQDRADHTVCG